MLSAISATRRYGERVAVDNLTLEIAGGEIFGLVGPNGAGKTTTLRMFAGLIPSTGGEIRVDGTHLHKATSALLRPRIGFLTESPGLWEHLSVLDNLLTYAKLFDVRDAGTAVERELRAFALWERRGDRAAQLSKGMKQKVALARALVHSPRIILLDEPTANLDPQTSRDVRELLLELRSRGCAIVVSSHNLDEVERLADRIGLISTRLIALGSPAELRRDVFGLRLRIRLTASGRSAQDCVAVAERAGARDVRITDDGLSLTITEGDAVVPAVIAALVDAGANIREAVDERPKLEEVYLKLLQPERPS